MTISVDYIVQRLRTTRAAQERLKDTWVWKKKTLAQWDSDISALDDARDAYADAVTLEDGARGAQSEALDRLHAKTKLAVGVAKAEFADDPAVKAAFAPLTAARTSLTARVSAAQALASAWQQHAPDWEPAPGFTLADYDALRAEVAGKRQALESAVATTRQKNAELGTLAKSLDKETKAWYAVATRIFPADTAEGALLRAELP